MKQAHFDGDHHHQLEKCTCMQPAESSLNSSIISPDMYLSKGQKKVEQKKVWLPLYSRSRCNRISLVIDAIASPILISFPPSSSLCQHRHPDLRVITLHGGGDENDGEHGESLS